MNSINMDENSFWKWMSLGISVKESKSIDFLPESNKDYVRLLSNLMKNYWESIVLNRHAGINPNSAKTLDSLSRHIPRKYFLELQFCLGAYSSIFATLFPPMLSYLDNLPYIEWLLYMETDNERYRDHLVHMFRVAFICDRLMQQKPIRQKAIEFQFSSAHFLEWCQDKLFIDPSGWDSTRKDRLLYTASYLSAIFHDFGYGYYYLNLYRQRLAGILPSLVQNETTGDIQHRDMARMRDSLAAKFVTKFHYAFQDNKSPANKEVILSGFFRDNLGLNHSLASGVFLTDLAGNLYDQHAISNELYIAFHLAAEAAMLHDMTNNKKWLHFSINNERDFLFCEMQKEVPIAALLCIADNLEFGDRARIKKEIKDYTCNFCMNEKNENKLLMKYDASNKCLVFEPKELLSNKNFRFIFDSKNNYFVLFDFPINKSNSNS